MASASASDAAEIVSVFRQFDQNRNGVIDREELTSVLQKLAPDTFAADTLDALMEAVDKNRDGQIQYEEFVAWITAPDGGDATAAADDDRQAVWDCASSVRLPAGAASRLSAILAMSPHLSGNPTFKEAKEALDKGDEAGSVLLADRLLILIVSDINRIDAAFMKFDYDGNGTLNSEEQRAMFKYLFFPDPEVDAEAGALLAKLDKDGSGRVERDEFKSFVEMFGGCDSLFRLRRQRCAIERSATDPDGRRPSTCISSEQLGDELAAAGIDPGSRAYWELVLPETELQAVGLLTDCQKTAVRNIRQIAKVNHSKALPKLQKRVNQLGYKDMDLWTALSFVRDFAPIIVHFHFDKMAKFLKEDTHYRSQFETGSSCGLNNRKVREKWEHDLFQGAYDGCKDFEKPKYGVLNVMNDYRGVVRAQQYGDGYMVLKDTRLRTTFSPEDSANLKAERLACLDYYAHVLNEYTDTELSETLRVAKDDCLGSSESIVAKGLKYKEAQFHGEIAFAKHVERIVLPRVAKYTSRQSEIEAVCAQHRWEFSWMDDEKLRREALQAEQGSDSKVDEWRAKLKAMVEGPRDAGADGERIPDGFCVKGCGMPVAAGRTARGNPFKTCCKGCALGFGHDLRCGHKEGDRLACKKGCGMLAAPGMTKRGNPMDTCCRGCVKGSGHDATCTQEPAPDADAPAPDADA